MKVERDERGLITWNGQVVPWVTRWTDEADSGPQLGQLQLLPDGTVSYAEGEYENERDRDGVLWVREATARGGQPEYRQVSVYRHRASMRQARCQVCGKAIHQDVIHWLVPKVDWHWGDETHPEPVTSTPPVCDSCVPVALALCPHLREQDWVVIKTLDYALWGVRGERFARDDAGEIQHTKQLFGYGHTSKKTFRSVVAKQQLIVFLKFVVGDLNTLPDALRDNANH